MTARVYQFGCRPPIVGLDVVRAQFRAAHDYQNVLIAIERGRRGALRAIDEASPEVQLAKERLIGAAKKERRAAMAVLREARKAARAAAAEEIARIGELDAQIRRDARELTTCFWGTYLDVEARHQQARSAPLYDADGVTPAVFHPHSYLDGFDYVCGVCGTRTHRTPEVKP